MKRRLFVILEELTRLPSWKNGQLQFGNRPQKQTENGRVTRREFPKVIGGLETRLDVFPGITHWVNTQTPGGGESDDNHQYRDRFSTMAMSSELALSSASLPQSRRPSANPSSTNPD